MKIASKVVLCRTAALSLNKLNENYFKSAIRNIHLLNRSTREVEYHNNWTQIRLYNTKMFKFSDYDVFGFDLDNCLVRYQVKNMIYHEYGVLSEYLVNKGYSKDLLKPVDDDFLQKGLILDFERGNLLRVCPDGSIQKAYHGTREMSNDEISLAYENKRWEVTDEYCKDMLVAWNGTLADQIRTCLDYFDMPAALAFARIVDSIDVEKGCKQEKYEVWPDVLAGLVSMYRRDFFDSTESKYFSELRANPSKYLYKCDPKVIDWLRNAKKEKKTFLVTGSHIDFATFTASYTMGPDWKDLFDIIICFAKKPGFFTMDRPFLQINGNEETDPINANDMKPNSVYSQGNFTELKVFLSKLCNKETPKIVYAGDNLIQDVFTPNRHSGIDTVAIVEEMMCEGVDYVEEYEILRSSAWGSYFHSNGNDTLWENIVRRHAKICVPTVYEFCKNSIDYEYTAFDPKDNSVVGYYPHDPFDPYVKKE